MIDKNLRNNRVHNAARMTITGEIYVISSIVFPFLIRTLMIYEMGDDYAGINSVFNAIVSLLNITEMGLGTVIVYFLYSPLAQGNIEKVGAYLNTLKRIYLYMFCVVVIIGSCIAFFLDSLVSGSLPQDAHIHISYFILLASSALMYIGFPDAEILFNAGQRGDINNLIKLISTLVAYFCQLISIIILKSFVFYFIAILLQSIISILLRYYAKHKYFNNIVVSGDLDICEKKDIQKRVLSMLGHQMDERIISSVDNITLSLFCGLGVVTIYGNYIYVVSAVGMFFIVLFNSITLTVGNAIVVETKESNYTRFKMVLFINETIIVCSFACMLCMYTPFMKLWMGDRLLPFSTVFLFCIYFFTVQIRKTVISFKNANGMWWEDRFKPYVSMIINLILDVCLVKAMGINGALISSIICIAFIEIPWESRVLIKGYFREKTLDYYRRIIICLILSVLFGGISYYICNLFASKDLFISFIYSFIVPFLVASLGWMVLYWNSEEMKFCRKKMRGLIIKR